MAQLESDCLGRIIQLPTDLRAQILERWATLRIEQMAMFSWRVGWIVKDVSGPLKIQVGSEIMTLQPESIVRKTRDYDVLSCDDGRRFAIYTCGSYPKIHVRIKFINVTPWSDLKGDEEDGGGDMSDIITTLNRHRMRKYDIEYKRKTSRLASAAQ